MEISKFKGYRSGVFLLNNPLSFRKIMRIGLISVSLGLKVGCGPTLPEYSDPLPDIGKIKPVHRFSNLKLGVILSENARKSIKHLGETSLAHSSYDVLANITALEDADPHYLTQRLNQILEGRFKEVIVIKGIEEEKTHTVDMGMVLDFRTKFGHVSGTKTNVFLSGIFTDTGGRVIEKITGEGTSTVPFPASSSMFKPAANTALKSFSENFDGSTKLIAELKRMADRKNQLASQALKPLPPAPPFSTKEDYTHIPAAVPGNLDLGSYHALVIGNNDYNHLPKLQTAIHDARQIAAILRDIYGFKVYLILNGTRHDIVSLLDKLRGELTRRDNLLIYYAGHGHYDKDAGRGYWLPVDASEDTSADWVSNADITDKLKALRAKHVMVVADSCYSGTLTRGLKITRRNSDYLLRISEKRARTVLTSGGLEPVMDGGGGEHSVFAKAFINVLLENRGIMDGTQLFIHIRRPVMVNAPQTPQYSDIRFAGHEGGDFLFVRKDASSKK